MSSFKELMYSLVEQVCHSRAEFTSDDVWDLYDAIPPGKPGVTDNRAFGPVMLRARNNGLCKKAGKAQVPSRRPELHQTPLEIWTSLVRP